MKIAFDSQAFTMQEYGGISRYFCSLLVHLEEFSKVEAKVFAPFYINSYLAKVPKNLVFGIKVPKIPKIGRISQVVNQLVARPAIHRFNPQIVHGTYYSTISAAPKGVCRIVTVYDMIHEHFPAVFAARDLTSISKIKAVKRADHVICISENTRRDLIDFFKISPDKISVVYLGYDEFPSCPGKTTAPDCRFDPVPYLLYVGARDGYKNFTGLLKAYASSDWLSNNVRLICFGGGRFESKELDLIRALGLSENHVMQTGGSDAQLAEYYRNATAFVYPSLYEGFGIPPLEAMSLNCPVICSDTSSIPEVVGGAAEYFAPDNIESMRCAIESVLQSEQRRNELIHIGAERCKDFSWSRCASETLAVYQRVI